MCILVCHGNDSVVASSVYHTFWFMAMEHTLNIQPPPHTHTHIPPTEWVGNNMKVCFPILKLYMGIIIICLCFVPPWTIPCISRRKTLTVPCHSWYPWIIRMAQHSLPAFCNAMVTQTSSIEGLITLTAYLLSQYPWMPYLLRYPWPFMDGLTHSLPTPWKRCRNYSEIPRPSMGGLIVSLTAYPLYEYPWIP